MQNRRRRIDALMLLYQLGYNRLWAPAPKYIVPCLPPSLSTSFTDSEGFDLVRVQLRFEMVFGNKDLVIMILKYV